MEHATVVSCPYFTATVAHGQQVRAQLKVEGVTGVSLDIRVHLNLYAHKHKLRKQGVSVCLHLPGVSSSLCLPCGRRQPQCNLYSQR